MLAFYVWVAAQQKRYDYVIKTDDDTYVHPFNMQRLLTSLPRKGAYWGKVSVYAQA